MQMRYLLATILMIGLLAGILLGSILALNIITPLERVVGAVNDLAQVAGKKRLSNKGRRRSDDFRVQLTILSNACIV